MASFSFGSDSFTVNFSARERRALNRPGLSFDKSRIISAEIADFPEKRDLGQKISESMLFRGVFGEYRSGSQKLLVLGTPKKSTPSLRVRVFHPNIEEIWIFGPEVESIQAQLRTFAKPKYSI